VDPYDKELVTGLALLTLLALVIMMAIVGGY
jgi:hypothetical protein